MRILHIYSGNLYGGIERVLVTLAQNPIKDLEHFFALCYEGRLSQELTQVGCPPFLLGQTKLSRPWSVFRARSTLAKLLSHRPFDAVICHNAWAHGLFGSVAQRRKIPVALWLHNTFSGRPWVERLSLRVEPEWIISNSSYTQRSVQSWFGPTRREVIYCPVKRPELSIESDLKAQAREKFRRRMKVEKHQVVLTQVSRLEPLKGQTLLLEALGQMKDDPNWTCWLTGGPPQRPEEARFLEALKAQATRLEIEDRIQYLEGRLDIPEILNASDVFVQPNLIPESFGISYIEALYFGLPVVTTTGGGAGEILEPHFGILLPSPNATQLAQELLKLVHSQENRALCGKLGAARASELSDPEQIAKQLQALLNDPKN